MYSSFHCLCSFELVTHYTPSNFFVNSINFLYMLKNNPEIRKEGQKSPLFFVHFVYFLLCMLYIKYNTSSFSMFLCKIADTKIRNHCQTFTLLLPALQFLLLSARNVRREHPHKYTAAAYLLPDPGHKHSTMHH